MSQPLSRLEVQATLGPSLGGRLLERPPVRFLLLLTLGLLCTASFQLIKWQPRDGELSMPVALLPLPPTVWFTGAWILFAGVLWALLGYPAVGRAGAGPTERRLAVAAVALAYALELLTRVATVGFFGLERRGPAVGVVAGGTIAVLILVALLRRPPATPLLVGLMLGGGLLARVAWTALVAITPQHTDNMAVIRGGLRRLVEGQTPYAFFDFGTHANPMPYLPVTFLSYAPAYLLGLDLHAVSFGLSLALLLAMAATLRALPLAPGVRDAAFLALAVFYALPLSVSLDVQTEWQAFNLALVGAFCLVTLGRLRLAALAYGLALAAMPVALFCAAPLAAYALRTRPRAEVIRLALIAGGSAALPVLPFLAWDAGAFVWAVSYVPREAWGLTPVLNTLPYEWPYRFAWANLPGLRLVQLALLAGFGLLAWRSARRPHALVAVSAASYLALVATSGSYIGPHMFTVVPLLAVLAEASRLGGDVVPAVPSR